MWVQQHCNIQNQHTKINHISTYYQWTHRNQVGSTETFQIITKKVKYVCMYLTKYILHLYAEYQVVMKEIKEDLNKWKDTLCSWIRRLSVVKMSISPNLIQSFNSIPTKILTRLFLVNMDKIILKFIWKSKGIRIAEIILKKNKRNHSICFQVLYSYSNQDYVVLVEG